MDEKEATLERMREELRQLEIDAKIFETESKWLTITYLAFAAGCVLGLIMGVA